MRYVTPETVSSSNTTPQLANMLGTANKVREQITGVKMYQGIMEVGGVVLPAHLSTG